MLQPYLRVRPLCRWTRADGWIALGCGVGMFLVYLATLAPTLSTFSYDSNELIVKSAEPMIAHTPGAPMYVWLGHLFSLIPFGEIATRVNTMSAFCGGLAVATLYLLIRRHITGNRISAVFGAVLFGLGITTWAQAIVAELYVPAIALVGLAILAVVEWAAARETGQGAAARRWLTLATGLYGLALGVHLSNVLYLPAIGIFVVLGWPRLAQGWRTAWGAAVRQWSGQFDLQLGVLATLCGALTTLTPWIWVYVVLPTQPDRDSYPIGQPGWDLFYKSTLSAFDAWRFYYKWPQLGDRIANYLHFLSLNVGTIGLVLLVIGAGWLLIARLRMFYLLVPMALGNLVFFLTYKAPDIDSFFVPSYWVASCLIALGFDALWRQGQTWARIGGARRGGQAAMVVIGLLAWADVAHTSYPNTNLSHDLTFRDFYGNAFSILPPGAYVYQGGSSLGYDYIYYQELYGARPDLHIQIGVLRSQPRRPPWPPGAAFAGATSRATILPAFLDNTKLDNLKWFDPYLQGMLPWGTDLSTIYLKLFTVRPDPPAEWLVPAESPAAHPRQPLHLEVTPDTTLIGIDAPATAMRGRPWHLTRYWRTTTDRPPHVATILGDHQYIEIHELLIAQMQDYLGARGIAVRDLPHYVMRDDMHLVIPSNIPTGRYQIRVSPITRRLIWPVIDAVPAVELVPNEQVMTTIDVVDGPDGPAPDPRLIHTPPGELP